MSQKAPPLTVVDLSPEELEMILTVLEAYIETGVVIDNDVILYDEEDIGNLWCKLLAVEERCDTKLEKGTPLEQTTKKSASRCDRRT